MVAALATATAFAGRDLEPTLGAVRCVLRIEAASILLISLSAESK
jgi:hypothetical protein